MATVTEKLSLVGPRELLVIAIGGATVMAFAALLPHLAARAPRVLITSLTSLGFWVALSSPSGATPRSTDHPVRPSDAPDAPWSPAEGPPPLPSAGVKGLPPTDGPARAEVAPSKIHGGGSVAAPPHPAIHGGGGKPSGPLFPRVREPQSGCQEEAERAECMRRHPAGRGLKIAGSETGTGPGNISARAVGQGLGGASGSVTVSRLPFDPELVGTHTYDDHGGRHTNLQQNASERSLGKSDRSIALTSRSRSYVVKRGDSLWGIAEDLLGTDNASRVARYWPAIHRANRETIGRDPNFLLPGQALQLPDPAEF